MGSLPRPWGRGQGRGFCPRLRGRCQGRGGLPKALGAATKPWGCGQDCEGVAKASVKAVGAWPRPKESWKAVGAGQRQ